MPWISPFFLVLSERPNFFIALVPLKILHTGKEPVSQKAYTERQIIFSLHFQSTVNLLISTSDGIACLKSTDDDTYEISENVSAFRNINFHQFSG
jgi:hypothetical protein